ncbi:protein SLC31A2-like [Symsagittifera roscoffensis]|uniref:protein SLC31A2-like n=1 Tax=Symsagittifera roscoffensis TaxID=84072 RepID=UPI00307BE98D
MIHSGMDNMTSMNGSMDMMMQMTFYASSDVTILWDKWETKETWQLALSCICWFLLAVIYEGVKALRNFVCQMNSMNSSTSVNSSRPLMEMSADCKKSLVNPNKSAPPKIFSSEHLMQTVLHLIQMSLGYLLMLVVMTFNVWLFVAVIFGYTVGFFLFGWWCASDPTKHEHCG